VVQDESLIIPASPNRAPNPLLHKQTRSNKPSKGTRPDPNYPPTSTQLQANTSLLVLIL